MKVKLISATQNPIDLMWTAARTCYSKKSPIEIWDEINKDDTKFNVLEMEKRWNLVKTVLDSGHESIAESVNFTFAIEGVSRSLLAQITRHRTGVVFSVQSQRYVEFEESFNTLSELFENPKTDKDEEYLMFIANKYFIGITNSNYRMYIQALLSYLHAIKLGAKPEDARMILPNATKTNIVMTINLRELMHTSNLRLCTRAQAEIRMLFGIIKQEVKKYEERFEVLLVPTCYKLGYCPEHKSCHRKPAKEEVFESYLKYKGLCDE